MADSVSIVFNTSGPQIATAIGVSGPAINTAFQTGAQGIPGVDGDDGATWIQAAGAPSAPTGVDDDIYLNTDNYDLYQKVIGTWTLIGNIKGPQGPAGGGLGQVPTGGTTGQILIKQSAVDFDVNWGANSDQFTLAGDTGSEAITLPQTVNVIGTANQLATSITGDTMTLAFTNDVTMPNNLTITGNLTVSGTTTTVDSTTVAIADSMIKLAKGNTTSDVIDIGMYGTYFDGATIEYAGLFRDASDGGTFKLFHEHATEPTTTVAAGFALGSLDVAALTASANSIFSADVQADTVTLSGVPTTSASDAILIRNVSTGEIETRDVSTISTPASAYWATTGTSTLLGATIIDTDGNALSFDGTLDLVYEDSTGNATTELLSLQRTTSGTPAAGLGSSIGFYSEATAGSGKMGEIIFSMSDVGTGEAGKASMTLVDGTMGTTVEAFTVDVDTSDVNVGVLTTTAGGYAVNIGFDTRTFSNGVSIGRSAGNTSGSLNSQAISIGMFANGSGSTYIGGDSVGIGTYAHSQSARSVAIGNRSAFTTGTVGPAAEFISIGSYALTGASASSNIGDYVWGIGTTTEATANYGGAIGRNMSSTAVGALMLGYATGGIVTNSVANSFELYFDTVRAFKTGPLFGTQVTNNADPDTNLTAAEAGSIAWDTTDTELRVYNGATWETVGSGGGGWALTGTTNLTGSVVIDTSAAARSIDFQNNSVSSVLLEDTDITFRDNTAATLSLWERDTGNITLGGPNGTLVDMAFSGNVEYRFEPNVLSLYPATEAVIQATGASNRMMKFVADVSTYSTVGRGLFKFDNAHTNLSAFSAASGVQYFMRFDTQYINQTGTAIYRHHDLNWVYDNSSSSGTFEGIFMDYKDAGGTRSGDKYLIHMQTNAVDTFNVTSTGLLSTPQFAIDATDIISYEDDDASWLTWFERDTHDIYLSQDGDVYLGAGVIVKDPGNIFLTSAGIGSDVNWKQISSATGNLLFRETASFAALHATSNAYFDGAWKRSSANPVIDIALDDNYVTFRNAATGAIGSSITWTSMALFDDTDHIFYDDSGVAILTVNRDTNDVVIDGKLTLNENSDVIELTGGTGTFKNNGATTNTVSYQVAVDHETSATPVAGFGVAYRYRLDSSTNVLRNAVNTEASWIDATNADEFAQWKVTGLRAGADTDMLEVTNNEANGIGVVVAGQTTQEYHNTHIQLTQGQIQALNTTPIEIIPAPGSGKFIQVIGATAYIDHNGTTYGTAAQLSLVYSTAGNTIRQSAASFIDNTADTFCELQPGAAAPEATSNQKVSVKGDADATGAGGTIDVWVQYMIIDGN
jgi:hypothetical protein